MRPLCANKRPPKIFQIAGAHRLHTSTTPSAIGKVVGKYYTPEHHVITDLAYDNSFGMTPGTKFLSYFVE